MTPETIDPTQVQTWLDWMANVLNKIDGTPSSLLAMFFLVAIGWGLKAWKKFPNDIIPLAVATCGIGLRFCFAPENLKGVPTLEWRARNVIIGVAWGLLAWGLHHWVLYRLESIPWLKKFLEPETAVSPVPVPTGQTPPPAAP